MSLQSLFGKVLGRRTDVWRPEPELGLLLRPLFPGAIERGEGPKGTWRWKAHFACGGGGGSLFLPPSGRI